MPVRVMTAVTATVIWAETTSNGFPVERPRLSSEQTNGDGDDPQRLKLPHS